MTLEKFQLVEKLFFAARDLPADQRPQFLAMQCAGEPELRRQVESLLEHDAQPSSIDDLHTEVIAALASSPKFDPETLVGQKIGAYHIQRVIGRGGMGVVYLGHDERLDRPVAIKTLPPELLDHPVRLNRFLREARLLGSLSHPNIATVFGLEQSGETRLLVMEFAHGQTLAQRLHRGAMRVPEALATCRQIAAAVQAAHDAGVIHRDLKPGNVMLAPDGAVKVLDFGLARSVSEDSEGDDLTRVGAIVGTPGYMSPEQLRGKPVDKRADVFAFGCILYECLTGKRPFDGPSGAEMSAAVLEREPKWDLLPARTPACVRKLLVRCLAKDPERRIRDMGDVGMELDDAIHDREPAIAASESSRVRFWSFTGWAAAAVLAIVAGFGLSHRSDAPTRTEPARRFSIAFPGDAVQRELAHLRGALSRDGKRLALSAYEDGQLYLYSRDRDAGTFKRLDGAADGWLPSFSPDGQWMIYFHDSTLRKISINGGHPAKVADIAGYFSTPAWGDDGYAYHVPYWGGGIARTPSDGGKTDFITNVDYAQGEFAHVGLFAIPGSRYLLWAVWDGGTGTHIVARHLDTGQKHTVVENGTTPRVAATPRGHYLLWERSGTLYAAAFDVRTARRIGPEAPIVESVLNDRVLFAACFDVADDGTLVYLPGPTYYEVTQLCGLKPGTLEPTPIIPHRAPFVEPEVSADGMKVSMILKNDVYQPYLYNLEDHSFDRIVVEGDCESASISPDGTQLAYTSNNEGPYSVFIKDIATGKSRRVFQGQGRGSYPANVRWSPDGKMLTFATERIGDPPDVYVLDVETGEARDFCAAEGIEERAPRFSPTGKWLAYTSTQSGTREVYIRSLPDGAHVRQISLGGGDWPAFSSDGRQIYYRHRNRLYSVPIDPDRGTIAGQPSIVLNRRFGQSNYDMSDYTVHPDGRIILIEPIPDGPTVSQINFILNWHQLLP